ncbi:probable arabinosyltransferase ARAD1 isoform X2 [Magnolia sinica]|uniref:probable arabinosyltransferase ARAD1 isoform X2 n=1 Tax=Magnolia sinica TaxID=86752 RepID=UPI00265ABA5C|nr:probable arabinosyltransferase ARAD1 isoform X2 [Magnolia sinica]
MNIRSSQKKDEKNIKITKMLSKPLATLLFLAIVLFFLYIFIEIVDLRSHFPSLTLTLPISSLCTSPPPLKIYMYDLPRRFNLGMLDRRSNRDRTPPSASNLPPWPRNWGLKKQHSIEYWMMASLLYEGKGNEERDAVRVNDPAVADAFFVPFFSSLSFNTHGHYMTDPETEVDRQLQVDLLEFLRNSKYYQLSEGRDHVIPMHHPNAFRFLRDLEGIVRSKLAKILVGQEDVHFEDSVATGKGIQASTQGMRSSKFCLHPAGDTPSSCRLFDAIVSHCVPVIVSDRIELPFEDEIDYHEFSLFFSVQEALEPDYMLGQLRRVPKERWIDMWKRLKNISHHYEFQYPPKKDDAVNMLWRQVRHKLPGAKLAVHRNRRMTIPEWWDRR